MLTFAQEQGFAPLPSQCELGKVSQETTAALWQVFHLIITKSAEFSSIPRRTNVGHILQDWWVRVCHKMVDEAPGAWSGWIKEVKAAFSAGFPHSYNLLQFTIQHDECNPHWNQAFSRALEQTRASYRILNDRVMPFSTEQENEIIIKSLDISEGSTPGARLHLTNAGVALSAGDWGGFIHESISAVECAARAVSGLEKKGLSEIIPILKRSKIIPHQALASSLSSLYAYSSDESGVRHSLTPDGSSKICEKEAFLIFGISASFVTYLLGYSTSN